MLLKLHVSVAMVLQLSHLSASNNSTNAVCCVASTGRLLLGLLVVAVCDDVVVCDNADMRKLRSTQGDNADGHHDCHIDDRMQMNNVDSVVAQAKLRLRKDAKHTALPLTRVREICQFAATRSDEDANELKLDRSVGATLSLMAELLVADMCQRATLDGAAALDEASLCRVIDATPHLDFLTDILPDANDNTGDGNDDDDDDAHLDLGTFRVVDEQARDVGRLWLRLRQDPANPTGLLADGRIDVLVVRGSAHERFQTAFARCSATPRRVMIESERGTLAERAVSLVRGVFEFNDASRIDLTGSTDVARFWFAADESPPSTGGVDTLPDRGSALFKLTFAEDAVVDDVVGLLRTDVSFDCFRG